METAFQIAKSDWMSNPNINGVFKARRRKGRLWTYEPTIQFHVRRKLPLSQLSADQIIPREIDGVPTDIIQANPVLSVTARKLAAIQGGVSIGIEEQNAAGTLGLVMIDGTDGIVGITCAHVLLVNGAATPTLGGHVLHPAIDDGGSIGTDRVGIPMAQGLSVGSGIDAAGFIVDYSYGLSVLDTYILPMGSHDPDIYDLLQKVGRTSGLTNGQVSGIGDITIDYSDYGAGSVTMSMISIIPLDTDSPSAIIATGGDSGSVWYDPSSMEACAIHTAHELASSITYAIYFSSALGGAGISAPLIVDEYSSERKGSANVVIPSFYEVKGSAILSGSSAPFITRLTAVNQDTTLGYDSIEDIYETAGIRFINGSTSPTL